MSLGLIDLWMPILIGTVLLWLTSFVVHMVLKYHNSDYQKLPNEDEVAAAVRNGSAAPGFYSFPHCADVKEMQNEAMQKRFITGPVAFLAVFPNGLPNMGKLMVQQISYFFLSCVLLGYCAALALDLGADYLTVFRFVATAGFLAFGWATIPYSIWYGHPWSTCARYLLDAVIYGFVAAGTFAWLWPATV